MNVRTSGILSLFEIIMAAYISTSSTVEALVSQSCHSKENFHRDYWNIDDILAEEELVPCVFKVEAKGLGYLD